MSQTIEVRVPDIGGFKDVPVIDVLVKPGQTIAKDAPLVVLESDKASMEVPSSEAGVVGEIKVRVGDTVSEGSLLMTLSGDGASANGAIESANTPTTAPQAPQPAPSPAPAPQAVAQSAPPATAAPKAAPPSGAPVHASPAVR